jgi:steroid delta-isomerase-like uncharacterized protein
MTQAVRRFRSRGRVFCRTSKLGVVAYLLVMPSVGVVSLCGDVQALERTVDEPKQQQVIEQFITAYNSFDIDKMVSLLAEDIRFENYSGDKLTASATGIDEFRQLAEQSKALFSEREQHITSFKFREGAVLVTIQFHGRLAADMPNGPSAGTILKLQGTSEYFFHNGKIVKLVDRS